MLNYSSRYTMKYFFLLCCGTALVDVVTLTTKDPHKLTVVTNSRIAETLYRRIKKEEPPEIDVDTKNKICYHITGSAYHSNVLDEKRVYMHQMYDKLKEDYPPLFEYLHDRAASTSTTTDEGMIYTNRSRWTDVHVAEDDQRTVPEHVFVCLTIHENGNEETVMVHYVSREYNLSDTPNPYVAGRFVFAESALDPRRIELYNFAEEPAKSLAASGFEAERLYLVQKAQNEPEEDDDDDPICRLTRQERLRVCAQVLSSAYFEVNLKFTSDYHFVDAMKCVMNEIAFQDARVIAEHPERYYEEWMISCRPDQYYASYQAEYFLSRVYNSANKVFVYRRARDSRIVVENLFGDVKFNVN